MKREILFRGKRIDKLGNWVHGNLIIENGRYFIDFYPDGLRRTTELILETVGQFTGLKDKNGTNIFEGDILKTETDKSMVVSWSKKYASFCLDREGWAFLHFFGEAADPEYCEVIGNIHDNPELLK